MCGPIIARRNISGPASRPSFPVEVLRKEFGRAAPGKLRVIGAIRLTRVRREAMIGALIHKQLDGDVVRGENVAYLQRGFGVCGFVSSALMQLDRGSHLAELIAVAA